MADLCDFKPVFSTFQLTHKNIKLLDASSPVQLSIFSERVVLKFMNNRSVCHRTRIRLVVVFHESANEFNTFAMPQNPFKCFDKSCVTLICEESTGFVISIFLNLGNCKYQMQRFIFVRLSSLFLLIAKQCSC